jgi:L-threonylcarbamoyladenylate synthase
MQTDARTLADQGLRVGILAPDSEKTCFDGIPSIIITLGSSLAQIAAHLFAGMRELDKQQVDVILARGYERTGIGAAIWERLLRAAEGKIVHITQNQTGQT